jgi:archaellin
MVSIVVANTIFAGSTADSTTGEPTSGEIEQMTQEVLDEISSYIQIRDQKGKYHNQNGERKITQIALLVSPLVTQNIDLAQLTIQLNNGETVKTLNFDGNILKMGSNTLFEHPIWDNLTGDNFGFISIVDIDDSLIDHQIINDYSDNAYVVFELQSNIALEEYDTMDITLFPSTGITRTTSFRVPFSIKPVVTL